VLRAGSAACVVMAVGCRSVVDLHAEVIAAVDLARNIQVPNGLTPVFRPRVCSLRLHEAAAVT